MEQEKDMMQALIEKAWALHDKISDEIQYSCIGWGRFSPQHGLSVGSAQDPLADRKRLIAIREELQVLEKSLLCSQKLQSQQQAEGDTALVRLEESRAFLQKMITEHPGRIVDVIQEMLAFLRNEINFINQNSTDPVTKKGNHTKQDSTIHPTKRTNGLINFLDSCFKVVSFPKKLPKGAAGKFARLAIAAAILASGIHQHIIRRDEMLNPIGTYYRKKVNLRLNSTQAEETGYLQLISNSSLDVSNGRG